MRIIIEKEYSQDSYDNIGIMTTKGMIEYASFRGKRFMDGSLTKEEAREKLLAAIEELLK